jgi:hypothetical protein
MMISPVEWAKKEAQLFEYGAENVHIATARFVEQLGK